MCLHVPHAQQMVFRPDAIKKLTKQMETKKVVDLCFSVKKKFFILNI